MEIVLVAAMSIGIAIVLIAQWIRMHLSRQYERFPLGVERLNGTTYQTTWTSHRGTTPQPIRRRHGEPISTAENAPLLGLPAPSFRLPDDTGTMVGPSDFTGRTLFLLFWSPTCSHCMHILNAIRTLERDLDDPIQVVVISTGPASLHGDLRLASPVLLDDQSHTRFSFGAPGTPSAVLIDRDGNIASTLARGGPSVLALLERAPQIQRKSRSAGQAASVRPA